MLKKIIAAFTGTLAGVGLLFAPTATGAARPDDCNRVAKNDRTLCRTVQRQLSYAYATDGGLNFVVDGKTLVHEITHQGLTKTEMRSYLRGEATAYAQHVTGTRSVAVDMASLRKHSGPDAQYLVGFEDTDGKPGGKKDVRVELDLP